MHGSTVWACMGDMQTSSNMQAGLQVGETDVRERRDVLRRTSACLTRELEWNELGWRGHATWAKGIGQLACRCARPEVLVFTGPHGSDL